VIAQYREKGPPEGHAIVGNLFVGVAPHQPFAIGTNKVGAILFAGADQINHVPGMQSEMGVLAVGQHGFCHTSLRIAAPVPTRATIPQNEKAKRLRWSDSPFNMKASLIDAALGHLVVLPANPLLHPANFDIDFGFGNEFHLWVARGDVVTEYSGQQIFKNRDCYQGGGFPTDIAGKGPFAHLSNE
jgi:hypothetical protein